jgi:hypothetical protein
MESVGIIFLLGGLGLAVTLIVVLIRLPFAVIAIKENIVILNKNIVETQERLLEVQKNILQLTERNNRLLSDMNTLRGAETTLEPKNDWEKWVAKKKTEQISNE